MATTESCALLIKKSNTKNTYMHRPHIKNVHLHAYIQNMYAYTIFNTYMYANISWRPHHWRRLVKNIGWANQNIGGQKMVKSDKCMGDSQLLGSTCPGCPPFISLRLWTPYIYLCNAYIFAV